MHRTDVGKTSSFQTQVLVGLDGKLLSLKEISDDHCLLLIFVRHFALPSGCEHVKVIWEKRDQFIAQGFAPMFIGAGSVAAARKFSEVYGIPEKFILRDMRLVTFELFRLYELMKAPDEMTELKIPVSGIIALRPGGKIATRQIIPAIVSPL